MMRDAHGEPVEQPSVAEIVAEGPAVRRARREAVLRAATIADLPPEIGLTVANALRRANGLPELSNGR